MPIFRAGVSRADLLRSLAQQERTQLVLEESANLWMGYVLRPEKEKVLVQEKQFSIQGQGIIQAEPKAAQPILQLPDLWAVTRHETTPQEQTSAQNMVVGAPMKEGMAQAKSKVSLAKHQDLLPWARLLPALLKPLRKPQQRGLDVPRWVDQWARRERRVAWPRKIVQRLPTQLIVVLDFSERLWPYRSDMHRLCRRLLALFGHQQLSLRVLLNGPQGKWSDWIAEQDLTRSAPEQRWQAPRADTPVLIVSDLGAHSPSASLQQSWKVFVAQLQKPVALCPIGKEQMELPVFEQLRVLRWSPDAHMYFTQRSVAPAPGMSNGQADLLAMLACTRRVDPPLLRALRKLNPAQPRNAGLEGMVWNHPDVISNGVCVLKAEAAKLHQAYFKQHISPELKIDVLHTRETQHRHFRAGLNHEENLLFYAHADSVTQARPELKNWVNDAEEYARCMLGSVQQGTASQWEQLARLWVGRADETLVQAHMGLFKSLAKTVQKLDQARGNNAPVPEWVDPPQSGDISQSYWLVQDVESNTLCLQPFAAKSRQSFVAGPIELSVLDIQIAPGGDRLPLLPKGESITLLDLNQPTSSPIELRTLNEQLTVQQVPRANWLSSWGRNRQGLFADLIIKGQTQTLRYIAPGQFLMGSPEHEVDRGSDEGPQHLVTLTEGVWLADTTCTQALWQVLMSDNPSRFKGDEFPVENVNWDDVQQFLEKLQNYLPLNICADLPTEAEWEYACRAGMTTPFSFGENINTEQVNYHDNVPYNNTHKGKYRRKTVAVKALPANDWGLYQMHGNVWEWCADGTRDYTVDAVTNPRGASGKEVSLFSRFSVRGGGWFSRVWRARLAQRYRRRRGYRGDDLGFRFVLRSTGQAGAGGQAFDLPRDEALLSEEPEAQFAKKGIFDSLFDKFKRPKK